MACEFIDAEGHLRTLIDKVPTSATEWLDAGSEYPQRGTAACEVVNGWRDAERRKLARISTARPDGIDSVEGLSELLVLEPRLTK